ncbi:MAG: hypothetical protein KH135_04070 [Firmicutes bacterium]|nr:hypothetical protein [Bacillota bacterium]
MYILTCNVGGIQISSFVLNTISDVIQLIELGVPILLIVFGMLDLAKGVVAKKEEDMKKYMKLFTRKVISGAAVFFVISITMFMLKLIVSANTEEPFINDTIPIKCIEEIIER